MIEISKDVKYMREWSQDHKKDDDQKHVENLSKFDNVNKTLAVHQKIAYGILGGFVFLEFILKIIK